MTNETLNDLLAASIQALRMFQKCSAHRNGETMYMHIDVIAYDALMSKIVNLGSLPNHMVEDDTGVARLLRIRARELEVEYAQKALELAKAER